MNLNSTFHPLILIYIKITREMKKLVTPVERKGVWRGYTRVDIKRARPDEGAYVTLLFVHK